MEWEDKLSWLFRVVMVIIELNFLAIKISIVLEININSSSSIDRGEGTSDFKISFRIFRIKITFHIKISWLATLQFKETIKKKRENIYVAVEK